MNRMLDMVIGMWMVWMMVYGMVQSDRLMRMNRMLNISMEKVLSVFD